MNIVNCCDQVTVQHMSPVQSVLCLIFVGIDIVICVVEYSYIYTWNDLDLIIIIQNLYQKTGKK